MSDTKPPSPKADALAKQLKESLSRRRIQPWKPVLVSLVAACGLLALLAYWLYPRPRYASLQILALDVLCTTDEVPQVRAQLLVPPDDDLPRSLARQTVIFSEQRRVLPGDEKLREVVTTSDAEGQAKTDWFVPEGGLADFRVNYVNAEDRHNQADRGRIFAWPKDSSVLLINADEFLQGDQIDSAMSKALLGAAKEGWRIVYLAAEPTLDFRKQRGWIEANRGKLPVGPILGRAHFSGVESAADAQREAAKSLQGRFQGKLVAVVKSDAAAKVFVKAGLRTHVLAPVPGLAPKWDSIPADLK